MARPRRARSSALDASVVPESESQPFDMHRVIDGLIDADSFFELKPEFAAEVVIGLGRIDGRPVGVVANQPSQRAGTLDVTAAQKGARFVQWCDAFNVPLLTFVDTTGFEPGTDLEWRGIIRHGSQLVHAYAAALHAGLARMQWPTSAEPSSARAQPAQGTKSA